MVKVLDPETVTLEEMAQASRSLKYARWAGIVVGLLVAAAVWAPASGFMERVGYPGLEVAVVVVAATCSYRVAYEILLKVLPPN
jgi:hypothetical protein